MPSARRPLASSETRSPACAHETGFQPTSRSARYAVVVRPSPTAASHRAGTVRGCIAVSGTVGELNAHAVPGTCLAPKSRREAVNGGEKSRSTANWKDEADDLERIYQLRAGQQPDRPGAGDEACSGSVGRQLPDAPSRVHDADQAEALVSRARPGARPGRDR